jgi:hypothetical protein
MKCPGCGQNKEFEQVFESVWKCDSCLRVFISDSKSDDYSSLKVLDRNEDLKHSEGKSSSVERTVVSSDEFESGEPRRLLRAHR